ncbi:MAG: DUF3368 domain-containing protein [Candidatus Methanomethylicia archaeon]
MKIVSNTSVLIALENIGRLELLKKLFNEILIPKAVAKEYGKPTPEWIRVLEVKNEHYVKILKESLHTGEAEAIGLAISIKANIILLDDKKARDIAKRFGLKTIGSLGILILARKRGLIASLKDEFKLLIERSFWLSQEVINKAIEEVEEAY